MILYCDKLSQKDSLSKLLYSMNFNYHIFPWPTNVYISCLTSDPSSRSVPVALFCMTIIVCYCRYFIITFTVYTQWEKIWMSELSWFNNRVHIKCSVSYNQCSTLIYQENIDKYDSWEASSIINTCTRSPTHLWYSQTKVHSLGDSRW